MSSLENQFRQCVAGLRSDFFSGDLGLSFTQSVLLIGGMCSPPATTRITFSFCGFLWSPKIPAHRSLKKSPTLTAQQKQQNRHKLQSLLTLPSQSTPALRHSPSRSHQNGRTSLLSLTLTAA